MRTSRRSELGGNAVTELVRHDPADQAEADVRAAAAAAHRLLDERRTFVGGLLPSTGPRTPCPMPELMQRV
jgi:hypothetical protein